MAMPGVQDPQPSLAEQIRNYGKPAPNQIVTLDEKEMSFTRFLNNGTAIPTSFTFFQQGGTIDNYWNTDTLPLTEQAIDITAISLRSNLLLAGASPLGIWADMNFWAQSWLTIQYRQRATRVRLNCATLLSREHLYVSGGTPTVAFKPNSTRQDTWTYLQEPLKCGPQQNLVFTITFPSSYVSLAYAAATSPIIYGQGLTNDSGAFFQLRLKTTVKGESLQ